MYLNKKNKEDKASVIKKEKYIKKETIKKCIIKLVVITVF